MALSDYAEPLFVALTRPAMYLGVPADGFAINLTISYFAFFFWGHAFAYGVVRGLESMVVFPFVHMLMRFAVAYDPNCFRLIALWVNTRGLQPRRTSVLWAARWWKARNADEIVWGGL